MTHCLVASLLPACARRQIGASFAVPHECFYVA
jgi:hypothetical protein